LNIRSSTLKEFYQSNPGWAISESLTWG